MTAVVHDADGEWLLDYFADGFVYGDGWELNLQQEQIDIPLPDPARAGDKVAYLTATYAPRRGWLGLARAQVEAQVHPNKVWIVADSSPAPNAALAEELGDNYIHLPGAMLYDQRDALLAAALRNRAAWFTWLDDDDLHDPRDVAYMLAVWDGTADVITVKGFTALKASTGETRVRTAATILNNNALYRTERCARIKHPQSMPEDGPWVMQISVSRRKQRIDGLFMWLVVHGDNIVSNHDRHFGYMDKNFEIHVFRGQPLYISQRCAYSTTDWERFRVYMRQRHHVEVQLPPKPAAEKPAKKNKVKKPANHVRENVNAALQEPEIKDEVIENDDISN